MYTSTYSSSSPIRTSTFGVDSPNYQDQSLNQNKLNSYQIMNDGSIASRRVNTAYSNSAVPSTSISIRAGSPNKYTSGYNITSNDINPNKYQSTSYRSYTGGNELLRSNNSTTGNGRSHSYDDLLNDQNQIYRSESSVYNSTTRNGTNTTNNPYGQQQQQQQQRTPRDVYDEDLIVKSTDLSAAYEQEMIELVRSAFQKYDLSSQRELAGFLKRSADKAFASCWHCIVGRQFSSYVTHEMNGFIYLTKGPLSILLFKSGS
ncbi:unnamed protein product [Rotaria socialis]|uniref:Dynein light chain 1, cytoplasmic n=5 Tax=Rotaria socialis TaxID=392032 RepID=A0A817VA51_9BILA|nr:unnamed protein product [Rotaria socialis]CAF3341790.1 unnamed protein product [Rotaria socialis]CAF3356667.1 unnamed protein product [Rotaria socialis]CAF3519470.1 unnamed protein product [Rotaria socialis]CAF4104415.1 unnamed protein product [Rotaria socialis]